MVHISGQYFINKEQENIRKKENMGDFEMDKNGDFKESSKDKLNRAIASMLSLIHISEPTRPY